MFIFGKNSLFFCSSMQIKKNSLQTKRLPLTIVQKESLNIFKNKIIKPFALKSNFSLWNSIATTKSISNHNLTLLKTKITLNVEYFNKINKIKKKQEQNFNFLALAAPLKSSQLNAFGPEPSLEAQSGVRALGLVKQPIRLGSLSSIVNVPLGPNLYRGGLLGAVKPPRTCLPALGPASESFYQGPISFTPYPNENQGGVRAQNTCFFQPSFLSIQTNSFPYAALRRQLEVFDLHTGGLLCYRKGNKTIKQEKFIKKKSRFSNNLITQAITTQQLDNILNTNFNITSLPKKSLSIEYSLDNFHRSNQDTCLVHKPSVFEGQWVQSGDLLADCSASVGGELALGQNILIAYLPWEGYNFEDAILVSERLVYDDLYTSVHIERYEVELRETKLGIEEITREIPDVPEINCKHLNRSGIAKLGSWVEEGDILIGKVTPINKKSQSNYQKLLYTILDKTVLPIRDSSLRAPKGIKAKVIGIQIFKNNKNIFTSGISNISVGNQSKVPKSSSLLYQLGSKEVKKNTEKLNRTGKKIKNLNINYLSPLPTVKFKIFSSICFGKSKIAFEKKEFTSNENKNHSLCHNSTLQKNQSILDNQRYPFSFAVAKQPAGGFFSGTTLAGAKQPAGAQKKSEITQRNLSKQPIVSEISENISSKNRSFKRVSYQQKKIVKGISSIQIYLAEKRRIQVGDKMAGRHGNKGIISQILPIEDMPFLPDGRPLDMVLNPLGVPSRMNVGQIYECLLGLAGRHLGENFKVFPFDEIYGAEASRSFVYSKLYTASLKTGKKWLFNPNSPGKIRLYDGRTGETFDQPITVGYAYMLRLVHMVDDKIHARSTGPYSLVTQQPLRGRSKQGGQRLGEMEVWALEGYGAAFTLLEMLTIKSDDMTGRMTLWSNVILNKEISIGTPESFKVLICELQALCLDIGLYKTGSSL